MSISMLFIAIDIVFNNVFIFVTDVYIGCLSLRIADETVRILEIFERVSIFFFFGKVLAAADF